MSNIREVRYRIKSVKNTQQITRAMKMISAAKLRRAQSGAAGLTEFTRWAGEIMARLWPYGKDEPFLRPSAAVNAVCYVVFLGNRGLCGSYNHAVMRCLKERLECCDAPRMVVAVGRWGAAELASEGIEVTKRFDDFGDQPRQEDAERLTAYLKSLYLDGRTDEIHLVYQQYHSALRQSPVCRLFLPLRREEESEPEAEEYIWEPSPEAVLHNAVELYVSATVYDALRQARISEQAGRMNAMSAATDATEELIDQLSLELNRARQAAITAEISEIVGGTNALKEQNASW